MNMDSSWDFLEISWDCLRMFQVLLLFFPVDTSRHVFCSVLLCLGQLQDMVQDIEKDVPMPP